jgi:hypothetical protein
MPEYKGECMESMPPKKSIQEFLKGKGMDQWICLGIHSDTVRLYANWYYDDNMETVLKRAILDHYEEMMLFLNQMIGLLLSAKEFGERPELITDNIIGDETKKMEYLLAEVLNEEKETYLRVDEIRSRRWDQTKDGVVQITG